MHLPHEGPLPKRDATSCLGKSNHNQPVGFRAVSEWGQEKGEAGRAAFVCSLQSRRVLRPVNTVSSPAAGDARAPDTMESLGAVNISVSKVTSGQETGVLSTPFTEQTHQ